MTGAWRLTFFPTAEGDGLCMAVERQNRIRRFFPMTKSSKR